MIPHMVLIHLISGGAGIMYGYGFIYTTRASTHLVKLLSFIRLFLAGIFFCVAIYFAEFSPFHILLPFLAGFWSVMYIKTRLH